jgi:hypothetical protein
LAGAVKNQILCVLDGSFYDYRDESFGLAQVAEASLEIKQK